jgi:hypothetical protein
MNCEVGVRIDSQIPLYGHVVHVSKGACALFLRKSHCSLIQPSTFRKAHYNELYTVIELIVPICDTAAPAAKTFTGVESTWR